MKNLNYEVIIQDKETLAENYQPCESKKEAVELAKEESKQSDVNVFITWRRTSDNQRGYLNKDGNNITGIAW